MRITSKDYPNIEGFSIIEDFISPDLAEKLIGEIDSNDWEEKSYHKKGLHRRVQHYGETHTNDPELKKSFNKK